MRVGPMPIIAADKLLRILAKNGHEAEIVMSGEIFTPEEQKTAHPRTESPADQAYVDFDENYLEFIKADLVRLALVHDEEHVSTGDELDAVDWMCPKCGATFEQQGMCPTHAVPLVTFEDFAAAKRSQSSAMPPWLIVLLVGILIAVWYGLKH